LEDHSHIPDKLVRKLKKLSTRLNCGHHQTGFPIRRKIAAFSTSDSNQNVSTHSLGGSISHYQSDNLEILDAIKNLEKKLNIQMKISQELKKQMHTLTTEISI